MHQLFNIVINSPPYKLKDYLSKNPNVDINMEEIKGDRLLHLVTMRDNEEDVNAMTEQLLIFGANPNVFSRMGYTPLALLLLNVSLSKYGASSLTTLFIKKGVDVNLRTKHSVTPLMIAAGYTNYWDDSLSQLIRAGADLNAEDDYGNTPLTYAIENFAISHVKTLIEAGVNLNQPAFHYAHIKYNYFKNLYCEGSVALNIMYLLKSTHEFNSLKEFANQQPIHLVEEHPRTARKRL